jgi:hypothetical protein
MVSGGLTGNGMMFRLRRRTSESGEKKVEAEWFEMNGSQ